MTLPTPDNPTEAQALAAPDFETWWSETHPYATSPAFVKSFAREAYLAAIASSEAERIALEKRVGELERAIREYACTGTDSPCGCSDVLKADAAALATAHQRGAEAMRGACGQNAFDQQSDEPQPGDWNAACRHIADLNRAIPVPPAGEKE